jgi:hypothetical protein
LRGCVLGPLGAHLARDRFLAVTTALTAVLVLSPLFQARFLPLTDLHYHAAYASLAEQLWAGDAVVSHFYALQPRPTPYWLSYLILIALGFVFGPVYATHVFVGIVLVFVPLAFTRLLIALGRSPRFGLLAFALSWDFNVTMGFVAYSFAIGLGLVLIARALEHLRGGCWTSRGEIFKTVLLALVLPWTHAQASAMTALLLVLLALAERLAHHPENARRLIVWPLLIALGLAPWFLSGLGGSGADARPMPDLLHIAFWPPTGERVDRFLYHSLGFISTRWASQVQGLLALVLLFLPLALLRLPGGTPKSQRRAFVLYGGAWLVCLTLPSAIFWPFHQIFIYERFLTLLMMFALLLPGASLAGKRVWLLAPPLVITVVSILTIGWYTRAWDEETRPYEEIIDAIPPGKTVMPVIWTLRGPHSTFETLVGVHAYYNALKGGYTPHLFDTPNLPVRHRPGAGLPTPVWKHPRDFTIEKHGFRFDYVLVQGKHRDRFREKRYPTEDGGWVKLVVEKEAGIWRLYRVVADAAG